MYKVSKENHFTGVFCTQVLQSTNGEPVYFEAAKNSRQFSFETNRGGFNVYVRYSTGSKNSINNFPSGSKKKLFYRFNFTTDYSFLQDKFYIKNKTNLLCLICTNEGLNLTRLVFIKYGDALNCLQYTTKKGQRIITVTREGNAHYYCCYGAGSQGKFKCPVNHTRYLGL